MDKVTIEQAKEIVKLRDELKVLRLLKCPLIVENQQYKQDARILNDIINDLKEEIRELIVAAKEAG